MDIMDRLTDNWTFLLGLDHCCGSNHDSAGRLPAGKKSLEDLALTMGNQRFESVVVWCSTCAARFRLGGIDLPVISFARLVADRIGALPEGKTCGAGFTLHEPCKNAYLDLDPSAPREILKQISGEPVREMIHHGRSTVCCGWSLLKHQPDSWEELHRSRLVEAEKAGARTLVTVCHGCQWIMDRPGEETGIRVVNYIKLVGEFLGIHHRERFLELRLMGSCEAAMESIRKEMGERFEKLPFQKDKIERAIKIISGGFYGRGI
jgi:Fe-S oxidoreductase